VSHQKNGSRPGASHDESGDSHAAGFEYRETAVQRVAAIGWEFDYRRGERRSASMIEATSWPAARTAITMDKSQLSSATRRTGFGSLSRSAQHEFLMREGVGSVAKCGVDIVRR